MHPVETYLIDIREIRSTGGGVAEQSYYGPLEKLLNEAGRKLKPKVRCVHILADTGAGFPDYGLYTVNQFQRTRDQQPLPGQPPERGVIEVKPPDDDTWLTAEGKQVTKYWGQYGQVLVTNYRDFLFVGRDERDKPVKLESFRLADSEKAFWAATEHPRKTAKEKGDRLIEYLQRVMRHAAPLTEPEDLAWFLASYAREAKARIDAVTDLPGLATLREALEEALGMKFQGEEGERFFRATLIQTLFYGIFSSWVLWARETDASSDARFNWHEAAWNLHVPMIASLFDQIATPRRLKALGIDEVLDWTGMVLNRVARDTFFERFEEGQAVQYFYEPFLKAYDPQLRKSLGVWYTPQEIIKYQVARVDTVLKEELEIPDGLADPSVYVLDPCCGTGAYLVEVLKTIRQTLRKKSNNALLAQKLKKAAIERVFGFEILPAPFVVAHLQLGLTLRMLGAPLSDKANERASVYLTNALTGWEPPEKPKDQLTFPELEQEREAADKVKQEVPILVVLGNPPYNAFAGTSPEEEQGLVDVYKEGLADWGITKNYLDDLYVRFLRIAERRIVKGGRGIVSYISNFSYLGDPSFVIMRKRFLEEFDELWFDCMNGDSRETGKLTPDGKPDPSVFSTERNRVGIRVGTTIATIVRMSKRSSGPVVMFRHFWGVNKRTDLLSSLKARGFNGQYQLATPERNNKYSFRPSEVAKAYGSWPLIASLSRVKPMLGLNENRQGALHGYEKASLEERMKAYCDSGFPWREITSLHAGLALRKAGFDPEAVRDKVLNTEDFSMSRIVPYLLRPYDRRWAYVSDVSPLWNRSRPELRAHFRYSNTFFLTRPAGVARPEGIPFLITTILGEQDLMRGHAYYFPFLTQERPRRRKKSQAMADMFPDGRTEATSVANLSASARHYLGSLGIKTLDKDMDSAGLVWFHALAIGYSPAYLSENADGIRQDWPRIPLPDSKNTLAASAELGKEVAALLDTEHSVSAVTSDTIRLELEVMCVVSRAGGGNLNPDEGHLDLTAGWGHAGKDGVTMPGKGRIRERSYTGEESEAIERRAKVLGLTLKQALGQLGNNTRDVFLNDVGYWKNIPANVWDFYIGGYQVIKKWLSYREKKLLGRPMKPEEVEYVTEMVRRIAAILLLQPALDANYQEIKSNTYLWPTD